MVIFSNELAVIIVCLLINPYFSSAAEIAQLGEHQTEDLKVPG